MNSTKLGKIQERVSAVALLLLLIVCGAYLLCDVSLALLRAQTSRNWPTTPARIEGLRHCCLESQRTAVWYTYFIHGIPYSGAAIDLPQLSADQVKEAVEFHKFVPVHYDPRRPEISVLDPGFAGSRLIWLLGGLLYLGGGVVGLWVLLGLKQDVGRGRLAQAA